MLSFLRPVRVPSEPVSGEKQVDLALDPEVHDVPAHETSDPAPQYAEDAHPRVSAASVPTIDSTPTILGQQVDQPISVPLPVSSAPTASLAPPSPAPGQGSLPSDHSHSSIQSEPPAHSQSQSALPYSPPGVNATGKDPRRFSFPSLSFLRSDSKQSKSRPIPPPLRIQVTSASKPVAKKSRATRAFSVLIVGSQASSEKRAKVSAIIARSVIVGSHDPPDPTQSKTKPPSRSEVARVKALLLEPKTAAQVITQLRALPPHPSNTAAHSNIPIRAVCLSMSDSEVHDHHFAQLQSVATASISALSTVLADVHLVDLVMAPNMGFGAPVTARGLFAGAVPTAETVLEGIEQITPQLMALGYATGKAVLPDHKGVFVPADRISVLTYWWGFEVCLPPPTIAHLEAAESPGSALLNLLTAISVLSEGVREIIPFIRYIAQFVQTEWKLVKRADDGKGVVCTATWLLPVALVPRPWDFPDVPPPHTETAAPGQTTPTSPSVKRFSATLTTSKPSTEVPSGAPRVSSAYSAETRDEDESRPAIPSEPPVLPELVVSPPGSIDGAPPESVDGKEHDAYDEAQRAGEANAQ